MVKSMDFSSTGQRWTEYEYQNVTMEHWKKLVCFYFSITWMVVCVGVLQRTHQQQDVGKATGACVMLWAKFFWEPLGPALHVGVTLTGTTYPSFVADHHAP